MSASRAAPHASGSRTRRLVGRAARVDRALLLEGFVAANLGFLVLDIALAHSVNAFRAWPEWIPLVYSALGAAALLAGLVLRRPFGGYGRVAGLAVGSIAVLVGVAGLIWHLESQFFEFLTLRSLVYSAPFVAPLAFTGLGLLVLLNRLVPHASLEWGWWLTFLAFGGLVGDLGLSLVDHAQNGFFHPLEWLAVAASAFAVAFVALLLLRRPERGYTMAVLVVLGVEAVVGVIGFGLHLRPAFEPTASGLVSRVVYGPPLFAPLLFPNLALLAALGVWDLDAKGWVRADGGDTATAKDAAGPGRAESTRGGIS